MPLSPNSFSFLHPITVMTVHLPLQQASFIKVSSYKKRMFGEVVMEEVGSMWIRNRNNGNMSGKEI